MSEYVIHWHHKNDRSICGHGTAGFDKQTAKSIVADLNRRHPFLRHYLKPRKLAPAEPHLPSFGEWLRKEIYA